MRFNGPNGRISMVLTVQPADETRLLLESLAQLDTSKAQRLEFYSGCFLPNNPLYRALLPMKDLRTLALFQCENSHFFIHALDPSMSSSEVLVFPKLEEFILTPCIYSGVLDIKHVIRTAATRASRAARLRVR